MARGTLPGVGWLLSLNWLTLKRKRLQHNFIELILWVLLVCCALYIYTPKISSFSTSFFTLSNKFKDDGLIPTQQLELDIQLFVQTSADGSLGIVLANSSFGPYIVPPEYRQKIDYDLSEEFPEINASQPTNKPVASFKTGFLAIKCTAPVAVEIVYKGLAAPRFGHITVEKKWRKATQTFYEVILYFAKYELEEIDSGRYICQATGISLSSVTDNSVHRKFIDIFVPGEMKLLHNGLWNDQGLLGRASAAATPIILYYDVGRGGKEITLPCGVSHPQTKVSLYHQESKLDLETKEGILFNALEGFQVPFKAIENLLRANSTHNHNQQFACKIKGGIEQFLFNIVIKDARNSHVSPSSSLVVVEAGQLPVQMFVCEAQEPVMIRWLDGPPAVTLKEATKNESYKLSFIATPMHYVSTKGSMSRIQCSRKRDGMIIHVWEWVGNGVAEPFLSYNQKRKELSCCMNSAHTPPQLVVIACSTMLECQVKGSFQPKIAPGGSNLVSNNAGGCNVWTVPDSFQAGVILCNQVNSNPFRDPSQNKEFPPVFFKWNDDVVVISKRLSSKPLKDLITMRLSNNESGDGYQQVKVECLASTLVFAKGLRWTLHSQNGQVFQNLQFDTSWEVDYLISYQEDYSIKDSTIYGKLLIRSTVLSTNNLEIKKEKDGMVKLVQSKLNKIDHITCEAPLWNVTDVWIASAVNNVGI